MKEYETVYITQPELTDSQIGQLNDRVKAIVEKNEGTLFFARSMGTKKLAYAINKKTKGIYYCLDYAAAGDTVHEIERVFRLNEDVVRFLTIVKSEKVDIEARSAEIAARGEDKSVEQPKPEEAKPATEVKEEVKVEAKEEVKVEAKEEGKKEEVKVEVKVEVSATADKKEDKEKTEE